MRKRLTYLRAFMIAAFGMTVSINATPPVQTASFISTETDCGIVNFIVNSPEAGNYFANFRVFPGKLSDGSFSSYEVEINGSHAGILTAETSGWQNITMKNLPTVALNKGKNTIRIKGTGIDVPSVECVKFGSSSAEAAIDDMDYQTFALAAEQGNLMQGESTQLTRPDLSVIADFYTVPVSYTYTKYLLCKKGEKLSLESHTRLKKHIMDVFYCDKTTEEIQGLNWLNLSETKGAIMGSPFIAAKINITVPKDGLYCIMLRGTEDDPTGVATLYVNGTEFEECAYSYNPLAIGFPADGQQYRVEAQYTGELQDKYPYGTILPQIFIQGAGSEPGRIVESTLRYSDLASEESMFTTGICVPYKVRTTGMHFSTLNSLAPVVNCDVMVWKGPYVENSAVSERKAASTAGIGEVMGGNLNASVYPSPVAMNENINISGESISGIEIYDMAGNHTYSSANGVASIAAADFAKSGKGIYLIRINGATDYCVTKVLVK